MDEGRGVEREARLIGSLVNGIGFLNKSFRLTLDAACDGISFTNSNALMQEHSRCTLMQADGLNGPNDREFSLGRMGNQSHRLVDSRSFSNAGGVGLRNVAWSIDSSLGIFYGCHEMISVWEMGGRGCTQAGLLGDSMSRRWKRKEEKEKKSLISYGSLFDRNPWPMRQNESMGKDWLKQCRWRRSSGNERTIAPIRLFDHPSDGDGRLDKSFVAEGNEAAASVATLYCLMNHPRSPVGPLIRNLPRISNEKCLVCQSLNRIFFPPYRSVFGRATARFSFLFFLFVWFSLVLSWPINECVVVDGNVVIC